MVDHNIPPKEETFVKGQIYTIVGEPIPLARPRFNTKTKNVFDSQIQAKFGAGLQLRSQYKYPPITTPIHINVSFCFPCSKKDTSLQPHAKKPDIDNLIKFLLDVGNGIIWNDDALIASIFAQKIYDNNIRTEFTIHPVRII